MIDFNTAIELIRRNGGFKPNRGDTSYYRTYTMEDSRPMQARVSNHGTWLWTWYDKDYDPSYAINTCVVYSENGEDKSDVSVDMEIKDEEGNVVGERKSFEVTQYVYNCQILDDNDAALINQAVQNIWQNKGFKDPLTNTHKHAKVMILRPNETPEIITETKYTNMNKKQVRLTESDLKQIVKESVNKILSEVTRTTYDEKMKQDLSQPFERLENAIKDVLGMLTGWNMNTQGKNLPDYAKMLGYTKSRKRFIIAIKHMKEVQRLINAAKQDMLANPNPYEPMGVGEIPKIKRLSVQP